MLWRDGLSPRQQQSLWHAGGGEGRWDTAGNCAGVLPKGQSKKCYMF